MRWRNAVAMLCSASGRTGSTDRASSTARMRVEVRDARPGVDVPSVPPAFVPADRVVACEHAVDVGDLVVGRPHAFPPLVGAEQGRVERGDVPLL